MGWRPRERRLRARGQRAPVGSPGGRPAEAGSPRRAGAAPPCSARRGARGPRRPRRPPSPVTVSVFPDHEHPGQSGDAGQVVSSRVRSGPGSWCAMHGAPRMAKLWVTRMPAAGGTQAAGPAPAPLPRPAVPAGSWGRASPSPASPGQSGRGQPGRGARGGSGLGPCESGALFASRAPRPAPPAPHPAAGRKVSGQGRAAARRSPGVRCSPPTVSQAEPAGQRRRPPATVAPRGAAGPGPRPAGARAEEGVLADALPGPPGRRGKSPCCLQITNLRSRIDQAQKQ